METKEQNPIELRSPKVRRLIGEIPPALVRWGTILIIVIFIALALSICLIPYPYGHGETILGHIIGL
ncbi:MAG: hypothetical protein K2H32_05600 [Muribaculaceae bacterium]|nr:hypothetical protein [Muribaculaceae bacterium]MDE5844569.1 hypothetical protein [Muribaculaceae bacterium]MDE5857811.1 hypothetical protein [Muribaculaceae bacterium]MDE7368615.1 hypothetical protein [Muribaculaceae bacterium]